MRTRLFALVIFVMLLGFESISLLQKRIVVFESRESKDKSGQPVFNQIRFIQNSSDDLWEMRQLHPDKNKQSSVELDVTAFDKADFVSTSVTDGKAGAALKTAVFRQFEPSEWGAKRTEREYSVNCGLCHSNGPRLVRPKWDSVIAPIGVLDALTIGVWNLRIKTYGLIEPVETFIGESESLLKTSKQRVVRFNLKGSSWKQPLQLESCSLCHGPKNKTFNLGWLVPEILRRNVLTKQNFLSISHLTQEGSMPPPLHSLSSGDEERLGRFLKAVTQFQNAN